jgi:hypothetical protein
VGILESRLTLYPLQSAINELASVGLNQTLVHNSFSLRGTALRPE